MQERKHVRLQCIFYLWLHQLHFMGANASHLPVDKNAVRNNIENGKAPYSVDANGRRPTKNDTVEEDRRFLFLNKQIVGDSPALKYASTAVETLLTGGSLAAGAAKAAPKIRKIVKALAPGFRRSGPRLGGTIKNKFNLPTPHRSGGAYRRKTPYVFEGDKKPLRLKGGGVPPTSEETPLLYNIAIVRTRITRPGQAI